LDRVDSTPSNPHPAGHPLAGKLPVPENRNSSPDRSGKPHQPSQHQSGNSCFKVCTRTQRRNTSGTLRTMGLPTTWRTRYLPGRNLQPAPRTPSGHLRYSEESLEYRSKSKSMDVALSRRVPQRYRFLDHTRIRKKPRQPLVHGRLSH
jgi:hypothetical protein